MAMKPRKVKKKRVAVTPKLIRKYKRVDVSDAVNQQVKKAKVKKKRVAVNAPKIKKVAVDAPKLIEKGKGGAVKKMRGGGMVKKMRKGGAVRKKK